MQKIKLSNGMFALVDDEDFDLVAAYKWRVCGSGYAFRTHKKKSIFMHHMILDAPGGYLRDHINGDRLDNRRSNLRLATALQNSANAKRRSDNTSGFKGVYWNKQIRRWKVQIRDGAKRIHLGYFHDVMDAARAYDAKAKEFFGEFARLNFAQYPAAFL